MISSPNPRLRLIISRAMHLLPPVPPVAYYGKTFRFNYGILRCVIPVVLSNNKNKLLVHMYIVKNTNLFLIVRLLLIRYNYMFRPSMLAILKLYMKHLTISYIYT